MLTKIVHEAFTILIKHVFYISTEQEVHFGGITKINKNFGSVGKKIKIIFKIMVRSTNDINME